tara:strand:- start:109 stop:516 length:408 start_codon:yes stop_codon:yes gene_type:complete
MEYLILEVPETSSEDELDRALRRIRARYHPDKGNYSKAGQKLVQLAEEAHKLILKKRIVNGALEPFIDNSTFNIFKNMPIRPFAHVNDCIPDQRVYESSYSYSNVNGNVRESGQINGNPMSSSELNQCRPRNMQL